MAARFDMRRILRTFVCSGLFLGAALAIAADAPPASACGNVVSFDENTRMQTMQTAERAMDAGKPAEAAEVALREFPHAYDKPVLYQQVVGTGLDRLGVRAQTMLAVAIARTDGLVPAGYESHRVLDARSAAERRKTLEWSIAILRAAEKLTHTPALQTNLAEALSKLPETREEAHTILADLDKKDLITSRQGFRALAELCDEAGDTACRDAAAKRYEEMTKRLELATRQAGWAARE